MKKIFVTTSWDDGHILDLRVASLLEKYGLTGTFYPAKNYFEEGGLSPDDIRTLATKHEIGAHTITHPDLTKIALTDADAEIKESKRWLEEITEKKIGMFCYPFGRWNESIAELVQKNGYAGARTTETFSIEKPKNRFAMPTSVHCYPFPFRKKDARHFLPERLIQPLLKNYRAMRKISIPFSGYFSFKNLARSTFDLAIKKGELFHLWGHSWEIEKYGLWEEFEQLLQAIEKENCLAVTNGELLRAFQEKNKI